MGFGLVVIEVCDANPACVPALLALEQQFPFVSVLETSCLSHCEVCARKPYVFLDGELISADDVDALLDILRTRLQELNPSL